MLITSKVLSSVVFSLSNTAEGKGEREIFSK